MYTNVPYMKKFIVTLTQEEDISISGMLMSFLLGMLSALLTFCFFV
jgi:hypothetical protein